jgi:hypothetical protein|tara:strand:+ start:4282 stop:4521 length:240 start_codon:yes stop_codon:yes gene_type:complete
MPKLVITEEMLDAIEAVKGRREANYWDPHCKRYLENQKNLKNKTKNELEEKGRELGIELDKRQSKEKLIKQIENNQKKG